MSSTTKRDEVASTSELRHRLPQEPAVPRRASDVKQTVIDPNEDEKTSSKDDNKKRTYGRTPDGTVFTVPVTHDMVSQLLSPTQPKNFSDIFIVAVLIMQILTLYAIPPSLKVPISAVTFLFWRACYNGFIGWLLFQQSNYSTLVGWAKKAHLFENPAGGGNPHTWLYRLLKRELEMKIPKDYKFEEVPVEFNTWLTFRRVVDLILMSDFTTYCLFAYTCAGRPEGEGRIMTTVRWMVGLGLVVFNIWVKLDAHRVVKDFAWYWGDFFFLIDQDLTFDGVYEIAPHPMYSVGYAGYYGISLMAASYRVLAISIVAHIAQFVFLLYIESPHIEKTYNPPAPRQRNSVDKLDKDASRHELNATDITNALKAEQQPATIKNILGLQNFDLHRIVDVACIIIHGQLLLLALFTPPTVVVQSFFVANAAFWRLWYSFGIGFILNEQSKSKRWTRHFIKYGEGSEQAWSQWRGLYHISMTMSYGTFIAAAYKCYYLPDDWNYGMATLRHVVGVALIALQMWTSFSIYDSLGDFGWFFGDFFFDQKQKLTYSGIYRFLNNPERFLGIAAVWGFALITWSRPIFFLALLSHVSTLYFIQFVERPHMMKRYGQHIRDESGISKSLKRSLPKPLQKWQGSVDRVVDETYDFMEDFVLQAQAKLTSGVDNFVKDYTNVFRQFPARITITRLASNPQINNPADYSLAVQGKSVLHPSPVRDQQLPGGQTSDFRPSAFLYGAPLKVKWQAPSNHSKRDWIGLYLVGHNNSKDITRTSSSGRWIATSRGEHTGRGEYGILVADVPSADNSDSVTGEVEFSGEKLWWSTGIFEFRYHHDGKHNVMAVSDPFEICVPSFDEDDVEVDMAAGANGSIRHAVEAALLPLVQDCFDRDSEIAPSTVEEAFGGLVERDGKYAKRVVYAVKLMFGIEFSPEVVKADGNVARLAWRICNAKQVLAPYSMTSTPGRDTPDTKY